MIFLYCLYEHEYLYTAAKCTIKALKLRYTVQQESESLFQFFAINSSYYLLMIARVLPYSLVLSPVIS